MSTPSGFEDGRLEVESLVDDAHLFWLAGAGARIRRAALTEPVGRLERADRPRGVLALGGEARLIRAVLEPVCPVPLMAWPGPSLPAWVGPLDLVVILGSFDAQPWELQCAAEAARRGATIIVAAPEPSELARAAASKTTTLVPAPDDDAMAAAIAVLALLGQLELGPGVHPEHVADAADLVAEQCGPSLPIGQNPAKDLAIGLAERVPLIWGGTVLAARASRRLAESLRRASGTPALAADASEIEAVLRAVTPADPFADPFDDEVGHPAPALVLLDPDRVPERLSGVSARLTRLADSVGARTSQITSGGIGVTDSDVDAYVTLLQQGRYAAAYLAIGLGRDY